MASEEELWEELELQVGNDPHNEDERDPSLILSDEEDGEGLPISSPYAEELLYQYPEVHRRACDIASVVKSRVVPLSCGGFIPLPSAAIRLFYTNKEGDDQSLRLPATGDAMTKLLSCSNLLKDETGAFALHASQFVIDLDIYKTGILKEVERLLSPGSKLELEVAELKIFTEASSMSVKEEALTLVVFLPSTYTGGEVVVRMENEEQQAFNYAEMVCSNLCWLCYSPQCTSYEVKEIEGGYQLALVYKLKKHSSDHVVNISFPGQLEKMWRDALEDDSFWGDRGAILAFPCRHVYEITQEHGLWEDAKGSAEMVPLLKGCDAELYHSAVAAGLKVRVRTVWTGDYVSKKTHGLVISDELLSCFYSSETPLTIIERYIKRRRALTWCHDKGHWEEGLGAYVQYDHKRGGIEYAMRVIAILVEIPARSKPEERSPKRLKIQEAEE